MPAPIEARTTADVPVLRWSCPNGFALQPEPVRQSAARQFYEEQIAPCVARLDRQNPHVFGVDFGRSNDLTVVWVMALLPDTRRQTVAVVELRNTPFEQQRTVLHRLLDALPRLRAGKLDARGNGQYLAEVTVQRYGERVEAVMLSEGWYRENMPPLKAAFEEATLTLPADREIHDDIRALKVVRGVARVPDSRTAGATGSRHGDAAVALAMAYAASRAEAIDYAYTPVPAPHLSASEHTPGLEGEMARDFGETDYGNPFGLIGNAL